MATITGLPQSRRTAVFRAMVDILRADPVLGSAVKTWIAWEGDPSDGQDLTGAAAPAIRLTPSGAQPGMETLFADAQAGDFAVDVEIFAEGFDMDDPMDLWGAVEGAFYPADNDASSAIQRRLTAASGGGNGMVRFALPAVAPLGIQEGGMLASGSIAVQVLKSV